MSMTWSVMVVGRSALAVLVVVDAIWMDWSERQVNVLSVEMRSSTAVGVLRRLDVLEELVDADVRRQVLAVGPEDVEQLLVDRVVRTGRVRVLSLRGVGIVKARPRWQHRLVLVLGKVHVVLVVVGMYRGRRDEDVIAKVVLLIVLVELLVRLLLRNLGWLAIHRRIERHFNFMTVVVVVFARLHVARVILVIRRQLRRFRLLKFMRLFVQVLVGLWNESFLVFSHVGLF